MNTRLHRIPVIQGVAPGLKSTPKFIDEARLGVMAVGSAALGISMVWLATPEGQRLIDSFLFLLRESPKANF